MSRKFFLPLAAVVAFLAFGAVFAAPAGDELTIPAGPQHWYRVNSMIVSKDSPMFDAIGGLHHSCINSAGMLRLKKGGSDPYPGGTSITDDVCEFSLADGSYSQGAPKAINGMVKNAKKCPSTGG